MWGPKCDRMRKPWVLRLKRWILCVCGLAFAHAYMCVCMHCVRAWVHVLECFFVVVIGLSLNVRILSIFFL